MIQLAVFDIAGTTLQDDDAVNVAFRAALAAYEIEIEPEYVNTVMGYHKPQAIRMILEHLGRPIDDSEIAAIHDDFVLRMVTHYRSGDVNEIPGTSKVFAELRSRGIKIALDTGFGRQITDVILNRLGWTVPEVIDASICSDEVARGRPHPDMIQALMAKLGITDVQTVAKIGDTSVDLLEGTNTGCKYVIGVTTGAYTKEQLMKYPHTHICGSIVEVPGIIGI